ncbi:MAG TPA: glycosyltransferase family 87 protein [Pirellulales bacterium]|nr:glycosyltransferase family 87 protein [Pirellulales bacterium]
MNQPPRQRANPTSCLAAPEPNGKPRSAPGDWCWRNRIPLALAGFFLAYAAAFVAKGEQSEWYDVFVLAARRMQRGEPLQDFPSNYTYPPAMAMLATPLCHLSASVSLAAWYLVNVVAAVAVVTCAWGLAGGPPLWRLPPRWQSVFWIGLLLGGRWFVAPLEHQQFDMVIAALLLAGCRAGQNGRQRLGAVLIGVSASMKCVPLLFAPYLLWRGKPQAALLVVAVAVGINLLPDLFFPRSDGGLHWVAWAQVYLLAPARVAPGGWLTDPLQNQSLAGLFDHLFRFGLPVSTALIHGVELPPGAALPMRWLTYATAAVLTAYSVWRCGSPWRPLAPAAAPSPAPANWNQVRTGVEAAIVVCLQLLLSPMTGKAHFVVLLLPCFLFARQLVERTTRARLALLAALLVCGPLTTKGLTGMTLGDLTLAWSVPTWFILGLLWAMWSLLATIQRDCPAEAGMPSMTACAAAASSPPANRVIHGFSSSSPSVFVASGSVTTRSN